ncbi:MAG: hypothetical protein LBQ13_00780 [Endomicrobium sp.]|jgi:hypothetical protein|nr:hypothetical protein [Endomicrobium sp.]
MTNENIAIFDGGLKTFEYKDSENSKISIFTALEQKRKDITAIGFKTFLDYLENYKAFHETKAETIGATHREHKRISGMVEAVNDILETARNLQLDI